MLTLLLPIVLFFLYNSAALGNGVLGSYVKMQLSLGMMVS